MRYRKNSHTVYNIECHIVFCTKYRARVLTGKIAERCRDLIREVCSANYVYITQGTVSPDHIHIQISIPPTLSILEIIQSIKEKSNSKLQAEYSELKEKYQGQSFWGRGYLAATSGQIDLAEIQQYIEDQETCPAKEEFVITEF